MNGVDPRRGTLRPYFAYGSNMLRERLGAADRAPSARPLGTACLAGHRLDFHKRSWSDRSGKCTITASTAGDRVFGVLFRVDPADHPALDLVEGVGTGYRLALVEVETHDAAGLLCPDLGPDLGPARGERLEAWTYVAMDDHLEPGLLPFDWYRDLVLAGARQNGLPSTVVDALLDQPVVEDTDPVRTETARAIFAAAGVDARAVR